MELVRDDCSTNNLDGKKNDFTETVAVDIGT